MRHLTKNEYEPNIKHTKEQKYWNLGCYFFQTKEVRHAHLCVSLLEITLQFHAVMFFVNIVKTQSFVHVILSAWAGDLPPTGLLTAFLSVCKVSVPLYQCIQLFGWRMYRKRMMIFKCILMLIFCNIWPKRSMKKHPNKNSTVLKFRLLLFQTQEFQHHTIRAQLWMVTESKINVWLHPPRSC